MKDWVDDQYCSLDQTFHTANYGIFHHVASQLSGTYIEIPSEYKILRSAMDPLKFEFSRAMWMDLLGQFLGTPDGSLILEIMARRSDITKSAIVNHLMDHIDFLKSKDGSYLYFGHRDYPDLLRNISDPPWCLSLLGDKNLLAMPKISLVGSRKASAFSLQQSENLAQYLASKGYVIVSGGALGVDSAAHLGALKNPHQRALTIVVFASGLNALYPEANSEFFQVILKKGGALVSERLYNQPSKPFHFLVRNRIVSGLSEKVLIMQAAKNSGALATANIAGNQGRDVYVLNHAKDDIRALGGHGLIDDGAIPFDSSEDFFGALN